MDNVGRFFNQPLIELFSYMNKDVKNINPSSMALLL